MKINNFKIMKGAMAIAIAGSLTAGLVGCTSNEVMEENYNEVTTEQVTSANEEATVEEVNTNVATSDQSNTNEATVEEASSTVDDAIDEMIDNAKDLASTSNKEKFSEAYEETKEQTKENFREVVDFLFNGGEIAGYTASEVKEETVEKAEDGLEIMDGYIESYIPDYKDRAKEKLHNAGDYLEEKGTDIAAGIYNKYQDLKNKTIEKARSK